MRMSYQRQEEVLEMPNLIEVQRDSYKWFLDEGLKEVFDDISPIADYGGKLSLEFIDFTYDEKDAKYSIEQCKERDVTYAAPLKVRVRLINKETEEINEHEIFMGDLPIMTVTGTFVINGAERVIVSQLVRSPGIYYAIAHDKLGKRLFSSTVIPNRGAWLEYETDSNDVFYVRVDRTRKVPITVLIRALGVGSNAEIIDLFGEEPKILASIEKDTTENYQDGLLELYKKLRPGEPLSVDSAENLLNGMFFDPKRYDLAKVGRYKFNKKLHFKNRIVGCRLAEDAVDTVTGEKLEAGTLITEEIAVQLQNAAVPYVMVEYEEHVTKVLSNLMVDLRYYLPDVDPKSIGVGQYQHDVDQTQLKKSLDTVVMSCVNSVGVNLNTASQHLLTYVSGLGPTLAKNIVEYRRENGAFASRAQLKKVPRLGPSAFEQCAGFLRIPGAKNPLDNSAVHPERYALVEQMAKDQGVTVKQLVEDKALQKKIDIRKYVSAEVGMPTLTDIMAELDKPGLDPRGEVEKFEFDASIKEIEDLQVGMVVPGIVTNITKFGAFVDIGVHNDGLVHVSQMSNRYIQDPSEVVKLHEHVMVRVAEVDLKRKRIALSMKGVK